MYGMLVIARYPKWLGWAGLLSMAIFRIPLGLRKNIRFWKLLGCGKNGSFDRVPDWRQWGILVTVHQSWYENSGTIPSGEIELLTGNILPGFVSAYYRFFRAETFALLLEPLEGHGTWDGHNCFGDLNSQQESAGRIAVLTRATIRLSKLKAFWKQVDGVAAALHSARGRIASVGIGEVPWIKQATFSIWESVADMKAFAYSLQEHTEVIRKTRKENWYKEEMFVRFRILASSGKLNGISLSPGTS